MDKLDQDKDDIFSTADLLPADDIPLLEDYASPPSIEPPTNNQPIGAQHEHQTASEPEPNTDRKENPFLPYEHLARLALEREQFTQSLEAFTENLKNDNPYSNNSNNNSSVSTNRDSQSNHSNTEGALTRNNNDAIIQSITNKVINHLKPIIEEQVAAELSLYYDETIDAK